ncbi:Gag-Pol polyprotein [Gossypium australe]|uniref:Gag-Pol polyprotein n=1 Tax=Gossypium australe TaxID=47621 RepID=A0A5B6X5A8_9ROSI|nr:Gag-Pol polyprotein [Gossypium australe]
MMISYRPNECKIDSDGCLLFRDRICIPKNSELVQKILHEVHSSVMYVHLSNNKMYNDLKKICLICQQVKAEHQVPSGLLQPITILEWE